ncbi:MAG: sialidase family protein [Planctomycetota bacterium]
MRMLLPLSLVLASPLAAQNPRASAQLDGGLGGSVNGLDVVSGDFGAVTVWSDSVNNHVYASLNDGSGIGSVWSPPIQVDDDTSGALKEAGFNLGNPGTFLSGTNVYVVWRDARNGTGDEDIYFSRSLDLGATWQPDVQVPKGFASGGGFQVDDWTMSFSPDPGGDHIYILMRIDPADTDGEEEIWLSASHDGGATFGAAVPVSTAHGLMRASALVDVDGFSMDSEGLTVHCVWADNRNGSSARDDTWYRRSTDGGVTWGPEVQVDASGALNGDVANNPNVSAEGSTVAVVWGEELIDVANEEVHVAVSTDGGVSFANDTMVSTFDPLVADADAFGVLVCGGNVVAFWDDNRTGGDGVYSSFSGDGGATWSPNVLLTSAAGTASVGFPKFATDGGSTIYVTGEIEPGAHTESNYSLDCGATWEVAGGFTVSDTTGDSDFTRVAYNKGYNNALIVWASDDLGNNNVYAGGYRLQTLVPKNWFSGFPTFVSFDIERFETSTPVAWVLASFSPGFLFLPGDGRNVGLTPDPLLTGAIPLAGAGLLSTAIAPDGSGSTPGIPVTLPPGINLFFVGVGVDPVTTTFGSITDVEAVSL